MPISSSTRSEAIIFSELVDICTQPGFIHAIAVLCFRDNVMKLKKGMVGEDFAKMRSPERLIRNEINALLGCMVKAEIDWSLPDPVALQKMIESSEKLLAEYHDRMNADAYSKLTVETLASGLDPTSTGEALREAIFYAAESAYVFQFRDMACERYTADSDWLINYKGYSPRDAQDICHALFASQSEILTSSAFYGTNDKHSSEWTILDGFKLNIDDIAARCQKDRDKVLRFISAFTFQSVNRHANYSEIDDFNEIGALPILLAPSGDFYLMQHYPLVQATYDNPFYWFAGDEDYFQTASANRGDFTENFLIGRLTSIFGSDAVFSNVDVYNGKNRLSEIDCLVLFGEYALIFQAKSQRLTLPARKGKLKKLQDDFQRAVQKAYDQAITCAKATQTEGIRYVCPDGREPDLSQVERVYPICVLADHYPALAMQARSFLNSETNNLIGAPLVCDLFLIDVMSEMLPSPLRFLSYITLRAQFGGKILVTNELSAFGYYLGSSLWIDDEIDMMMLDDSVASDLDAAMTVRREGLPGEAIPKGILTKLQNTRLGKIVTEVEHNPNQFAVGMGLSILEMGEDSLRKMSAVLDRMIRHAGSAGKHHDLTLPLEHRNAGLTIHINDLSDQHAADKLRSHMLYRKYSQRADKWYGILLSPVSGNLRLGVKVRAPHVFDLELESVTSNAAPLQKIDKLRINTAEKRKIGRNEPCPCRSGKKYKRCCLRSVTTNFNLPS